MCKRLHIHAICLRTHIIKHMIISVICTNMRKGNKFFLKSPRPSLPLKRAPPLFPSPFPLRGQGMCQPPYSVLKPLRYKVGGPSEVFASSRAAFCGMRPHGYKSLTGCLLGACSLLIMAAGVIVGRSQNGGRGMGEPGRKGLVSPLRWGSQVYSQTRRIS